MVRMRVSVVASTEAVRAPGGEQGHLAEAVAGAEYVEQVSLLDDAQLALDDEAEVVARLAFLHDDGAGWRLRHSAKRTISQISMSLNSRKKRGAQALELLAVGRLAAVGALRLR
jgi:hypothetical protein